jgi:hypothetical protein
MALNMWVLWQDRNQWRSCCGLMAFCARYWIWGPRLTLSLDGAELVESVSPEAAGPDSGEGEAAFGAGVAIDARPGGGLLHLGLIDTMGCCFADVALQSRVCRYLVGESGAGRGFGSDAWGAANGVGRLRHLGGDRKSTRGLEALLWVYFAAFAWGLLPRCAVLGDHGGHERYPMSIAEAVYRKPWRVESWLSGWSPMEG